MKKILMRILAICLVFSLFGCSSNKNANDIQIVFDAFNKTLNANSGILSGTVEYNTNSKQKINYQIQIIQDGNLQVKSKIGLEAQNNIIDDYLDFYIKDGKTYLNNLGTKSQSVAKNIGVDVSKKISVYNPFLDFSTNELSALFKSSSQKGNTYTLVINPDKLSTLLDGMGTLSISKADVVATLEKDHLSHLELNIEGYQAFNKTSYDVEIHVICNISEFNSLKQIDFPEDLETY